MRDGVTVSGVFSGRVRRALGNADAGDSGVEPERWRRERDRLADRIEPGSDSRLSENEARALIELLSESGPNALSRMSPTAWTREIESIVAELLGGAR